MRLLFAAAALAATTLVTAAATPAFAQSTEPFTGAHVDALAGYDSLSSGAPGDDGSSDGFLYGLSAGYDAALGKVRLGGEIEATDSTASARASNGIVAGDRFRADASRDLYVGARLGYVVSPRLMLYAKAGYSNARIKARYTSGAVTTRDDRNLDGVRVGAGAEYAISPNVYLKGEYRYSHYGDQGGLAIDADRHQLLAGVGFRF